MSKHLSFADDVKPPAEESQGEKAEKEKLAKK